MKELKELQKKYRELGVEIEALKGGYPFYLFRKHIVLKFIEPRRSVVVKQGENCKVGDTIEFCEDYGKPLCESIDVCPDTGFYDGQLVWCWDNEDTHMRIVRFYDAKNKCTFYYNGERTYFSFDKYEAFKGQTFENYEAFEGQWPEWALKAYKTLKK